MQVIARLLKLSTQCLDHAAYHAYAAHQAQVIEDHPHNAAIRARMSQISWRTTVAHQSTEDIPLPPGDLLPQAPRVLNDAGSDAIE
jgi:hypothetical protein